MFTTLQCRQHTQNGNTLEHGEKTKRLYVGIDSDGRMNSIGNRGQSCFGELGRESLEEVARASAGDRSPLGLHIRNLPSSYTIYSGNSQYFSLHIRTCMDPRMEASFLSLFFLHSERGGNAKMSCMIYQLGIVEHVGVECVGLVGYTKIRSLPYVSLARIGAFRLRWGVLLHLIVYVLCMYICVGGRGGL